MSSPFTGRRASHAGVVLATASIFLLGCARKLQIEVPAGFHGRVHITCAGLSSDRTTTLHASGAELTTATCPERQAEVTVTRAGAATPLDSSVTWTTTGDGLVREIVFDVK